MNASYYLIYSAKIYCYYWYFLVQFSALAEHFEHRFAAKNQHDQTYVRNDYSKQKINFNYLQVLSELHLFFSINLEKT